MLMYGEGIGGTGDHGFLESAQPDARRGQVLSEQDLPEALCRRVAKPRLRWLGASAIWFKWQADKETQQLGIANQEVPGEPTVWRRLLHLEVRHANPRKQRVVLRYLYSPGPSQKC